MRRGTNVVRRGVIIVMRNTLPKVSDLFQDLSYIVKKVKSEICEKILLTID